MSGCLHFGNFWDFLRFCNYPYTLRVENDSSMFNSDPRVGIKLNFMGANGQISTVEVEYFNSCHSKSITGATEK